MVPTDMQTLGRAFLHALVARLGYIGAGGVLMLLSAELWLAAFGAQCNLMEQFHRSSAVI